MGKSLTLNTDRNCLVIGITGGIASGKTTVGQVYQGKGYPVIFTDLLAHKVMNFNNQAKAALKQAFGNDIFDSDDLVIRKKLSEIVFSSTENKLMLLNTIVHPFVIEEMIELTDMYEGGGSKLVFIESALIYETNLDEGFDYIIDVFAEPDICVKRAQSRGLAIEHINLILQNQLDPVAKRNFADFAIENNKTLSELEESAMFLLNVLKEIAK
ncbi:MAG: dephospho-CoA kinase [Candidatus Kapabacteria bacterium]|nr:dephospho-CoA kinase [Candidatus Kapabacteria bacterium]